MMTLFVSPDFEKFLTEQGVNHFDDLWHTPMQAVEEGNAQQSGAKSQVSRWHDVYVKKQKNYTTRLSRWFKPKAVCGREFENIILWQKIGLPTLEALYFYQEPRARRAILVTKALDDYEPLDVWLAKTSDMSTRSKVFSRVASVLADIHRKGWYHRCFYPKHVFVLKSNPELIKIIDLEKARKQIHTTHRDISEIGAFFRRCVWAHPKEGLHFMKAYWGVSKFETKHRLFLKRLQGGITA